MSLAIQTQSVLQTPEPHQLFNAWNLLTSPRYIYRGLDTYRRYTLYLRDDNTPGGFRVVGAIFAVDRRDAWHTFVNLGVLGANVPRSEYTFLD